MISRAQASLTPSESKRLIARAVLGMDVVKRALEEGVVVIHPSTTTLYIMEEIVGERPKGKFVSGVIVPTGTCISAESHRHIKSEGVLSTVGKFRPWVIERGEVKRDVRLRDALGKMGRNDVYIKAGNAIDPGGNVGVFIGHPLGGTIGQAYASCKARGWNLIIPIGLEKLIPVSVRMATREAGIEKMDYSMGMPVGLLPIDGIVVTEVEAIRILTGSEATPIGAGGVNGAEGSITLVIRGEADRVMEAIRVINEVKGTKTPRVALSDCSTCIWPTCPRRGIKRTPFISSKRAQ
ncbi:MAG: hypothetical protein ACE5GD_10020 [Candidatus Geothermarchaeales archaeon]